MSTNTQIITDALRLIGVLAEGETASPEQASDAMRRMNQMIATWEVDDIVLGYFAQSDSTAAIPIPDWAEKGVMGQLAIELAPEYGAAISPEAAKVADDGWSVIQKRCLLLKMKPADMSHLGSSFSRYNIETDL